MKKESRMFSEAMGTELLSNSLLKGSMSAEDAANRQRTYQKLFSSFEGMKEVGRQFSAAGAGDFPIQSTQYFNATVTSYINSFSGFISIERDMDSPSALLYFMDVLGVSDDRVVKPNLGAENLAGLGAGISTKVAVSDPTGSTNTTIALAKKLVPNAIKLKFYAGAAVVAEAKDNGSGSFTSGPDLLAVGTVNYATGEVVIRPTANLFATLVGDEVQITAVEDMPGAADNGKNRFKLKLNNVQVDTEAELLIGESNIVSLAAMQKNLSIDPQAFLSKKLSEIYTQNINTSLVESIIAAYTGAVSNIDISAATTGFTDYRSQIDLFGAGLVEIDGALATKSTKGVAATSYVVGSGMADQFRKAKITGLWEDNTSSSHIEDLIGFYDGIPVMRSTSVGSLEGYALHKTADGNAAPTMRGIFLPLTNTPAIGNFNNPAQYAQGVYYQEGAKSIFDELVIKFTLTK